MDRTVKRVGLVNWLVLLGCAAGGAVLSRQSGSGTAMAATAFLILGFLVALVSWFQMRLIEREQLESLEIEEMNRSGTGSALFESADAALRPARRAREQFDRYGVAVFSTLLMLLQGALALVLYKGWLMPAAAKPGLATLVMTLFAMFGLGLFVLGNYAASLARLETQRLLRPAAGYLMLGAVTCFVVAGAEAAAWFGALKVDLWVSRAMQALLVVVALETLVTLVLEIYRPRIEGKPMPLLYESRLVSLVGQPEGFVRTLAHALDYQFGFKVSETGFYRFVEENLARLLLGQLAVLCLFTTFVIIEPGEQGLLERFGRPVAGREVLDPGVHFKLPWPVDQVTRHRTFALRELLVGSEGMDDAAGHEDHNHEKEEMPVILWTVAHNHEEVNFVVASGATGTQAQQAEIVNLLTIGIPIQYEVTNLVQWARGHARPERLLKQAAFREACLLLASVDYERVLAEGRLTAATQLRERIQRRADELELGVRLVFVGVNDVHPPVAVTPAYEQYVGANQEKLTNVIAALGWRDEKIPAASADAKRAVDQAQAFKLARISDVVATSGQFTNQLAAYNASPDVYRNRRYLETLTRAVGPVRKYVLGTTNTTETLHLNLEEKFTSDMLDLSVAPPDPR
jgi:modulator of FtsH protease HflK